MTLSTCLRGMTKNSSFLHFRAIFMSYCPQFWGSGMIYKVHVTQYMFERHDQKLVVSVFKGRFCELLPIVLGFHGNLQGTWKSIHSREEWQKRLVVFVCMAIFVSNCLQFWSSGVIYKAHDTQYMF
jgi:hypothetical protein